MKVVRNTVEGVKFIITTMARSVLVVVWHYECHQLTKALLTGLGANGTTCPFNSPFG
jgi:hypothetical protein